MRIKTYMVMDTCHREKCRRSWTSIQQLHWHGKLHFRVNFEEGVANEWIASELEDVGTVDSTFKEPADR